MARIARRAYARSVAGEDPVDRFPGVGQCGLRLLDLVLVAGAADLDDGLDQRPDVLAQCELGIGHTLGDLLPGLADRLGVLLDVLAARVGQREHAPTVALLGTDEPLVLEQRQRRVNGARAGLPDPLRPLADLLHQLVAVAWLLREEGQDRRAHVSAPRPWARWTESGPAGPVAVPAPPG